MMPKPGPVPAPIRTAQQGAWTLLSGLQVVNSLQAELYLTLTGSRTGRDP